MKQRSIMANRTISRGYAGHLTGKINANITIKYNNLKILTLLFLRR